MRWREKESRVSGVRASRFERKIGGHCESNPHTRGKGLTVEERHSQKKKFG